MAKKQLPVSDRIARLYPLAFAAPPKCHHRKCCCCHDWDRYTTRLLAATIAVFTEDGKHG